MIIINLPFFRENNSPIYGEKHILIYYGYYYIGDYHHYDDITDLCDRVYEEGLTGV